MLIINISGKLEIAEVTSRFSNIEEFVALICSIGFALKNKVSLHAHFSKQYITIRHVGSKQYTLRPIHLHQERKLPAER